MTATAGPTIASADPSERMPDDLKGGGCVDASTRAAPGPQWDPAGGHHELHVGTFTEQGTYAAAREMLPALVRLGVTTIELMPLSAAAGTRGWGYDGVAHFAPFAAYGTPDELRALVDAAHGNGLEMIVDVVYNHFGLRELPGRLSSEYFRHDVKTP